MQHIIVSRHPAAIAFIRRERPEFADAPVLESATWRDVRGAVVAGNLPMQLAAETHLYYAIVFNSTPPRGAEYTLADMDAAGAELLPYRVTCLCRTCGNAPVEADDSGKDHPCACADRPCTCDGCHGPGKCWCCDEEVWPYPGHRWCCDVEA